MPRPATMATARAPMIFLMDSPLIGALRHPGNVRPGGSLRRRPATRAPAPNPQGSDLDPRPSGYEPQRPASPSVALRTRSPTEQAVRAFDVSVRRRPELQ